MAELADGYSVRADHGPVFRTAPDGKIRDISFVWSLVITAGHRLGHRLKIAGA